MSTNQRHPMRRITSIHFVGIGGAGMSGIAEVLLNQGYLISGSDKRDSAAVQRLRKMGAIVHIGHHADHVAGADAVVKSTAVSDDNAEIIAAVAARIPVVPRAEMLAELMRGHYGIAIAGTHGKTTTTSLVAAVLTQGGLDPTFVIGGKLNSAGCNAHLGESDYFVAEADESDASFLYLTPSISVVTNIDEDHMGTYQDNFAVLQDTFLTFIQQLPFYGLAIVCIDNPVVRKLLPRVSRPMLTYGFADDADIRVLDWQQQGMQSQMTVKRPLPHQPLSIVLNMPGKHNACNALAAIAIATELGVSDDAIMAALMRFEGIGRRFQCYGDIQGAQGRALLVDDYGHHPCELRATMDAARQAWPDRRLVVAFQPHRYTRTKDLFEDFVAVLAQVDVLLLLDVYSAGEALISGIDSKALCHSIRQRGRVDPIHVRSDESLAEVATKVIRDNDVFLTMGAGSIGAMAAELSVKLRDE